MSLPRLTTFACAAVLAPVALAQAQRTLEPGIVASYGGRYSTDCRNPGAPHLQLLPDALIVQDGMRQMIGHNPQRAPLNLGPSPPPGYQLALVSELPQRLHLTFIIFRDQMGLFIELHGEPQVRQALLSLAGLRFRSCTVTGGATPPARGPAYPAQAAPPPPPPPAQKPSPPPAAAEGTLGADLLRDYGGAYSAACADATSLRVRVLDDALIIEHGSNQLTARHLTGMYSYYGQMEPPPEFRIALMGDFAGGGLTLLVSRDKKGQYLTLEEEPKIQAMFGKKELARKLRSCDPAKNGPERTAAPASPQAPASASPPQLSPWDLLKDARFKAAYRKALGPKGQEPWLTELGGPASPNKSVEIGGTVYVLAASCMPHDCGDNTIVILYSAARKVVYGKIVQPKGTRLIGAPPPAMAAELDRLWQSEYGQNR